MSGVVELGELLQHMAPVLDKTEFVFCTVPGVYADYAHLQPLCSFAEAEGLTLILEAESAHQADLPYEGKYQRITLTVHSSLDAVGLTAAVATKLASAGISANVVAAFYHDHVFVPVHHATEAMQSLVNLAGKHAGRHNEE